MIQPSAHSGTARCWTLFSAEGAIDVEVLAADQEPLRRLLPVLSEALGVPVPGLWSGSARLADDLPLRSPALAHASVLGLGRPGPRTDTAERSSALELHVVGGPEAGRTVPLDQGRHVLGRGAEASVPLDDPDVSRRHAQVAVGAGRITVHDLGSTNGSRLDDQRLGTAAQAWPDGAVLRIGASALTVRGPDGCPASVEPADGGRLRLRPAARMVAPRPEVAVEFPRPAASPPRRRLAWVAIALPAIAGVLMAWLMHAPQFLFFGLLSPVVALGTWGSDRWWGRRDGRRNAATLAAALVEAETRLADAVRADRQAAQAAWPDLAFLTAAARRRTARIWERRRTDADALQIRIGTGRGLGRVVRVSGEGVRVPEPVEDLPAVVDLREHGGLAVLGPRARTAGALGAAVAQVVALHGPDEVQLALVTAAERVGDWDWVRWLPHLRYTDVAAPPTADGASDEHLLRWISAQVAGRRSAHEGVSRGAEPATPPWLVVVVDRRVDARVADVLRRGRSAGVVVLTAADSAERIPVPADAILELGGETGDLAVLRRAGTPAQAGVVVDRLPRSAAVSLARDLAALLPAGTSTALPRSIRLLELPAEGLGLDDEDRLTGSWNRTRNSLLATLGRTADGPARIDLCRQGPHALVAGTTGSGKSELLQTLIAGLALNHPPDRCSFLLVDYKGGAAFADAVHLPHTVGLLTDLDGPSTQRALRALGAELTRRETVLAAQGVADIAALPDAVDLARLVIVVDEFATLAEEHPTFVPGLVGIAQRGRSLGVHLILATQRPGGVVSPEIRGNCTLRICLRTTDEADSRDVIGTSQAAFLAVDLPGRAYVRTGTASPVELQVARVSTAPRDDTGPRARRWSWPLPGTPVGERPAMGTGDLGRLAAALSRHAASSRIGTPHRPWLPPLPARLTADQLDHPDTPGPRLRIGLVDRPDAQAQEPLELDLAEGGGWLAVGGPRSGRTSLLRTVLAEAVCALTAEQLHVHVLDHGGGRLAAEAAALPQAGTTVGADDALRTVRLVARLAEEIALRRAGERPEPRPQLLLLVDGMDSISTQLDEADPGGGSATLLRLVRDGAAVGLTCVLTADRAVPGGRLAAVADHRLVLPLPDRADYAVAGIPARAVPEVRPPGRALLGEAAVECQLALPRPLPACHEGAVAATALRIPELAPDPELPLPPPESHPRGTCPELPIGPGGDEGRLVSVDVHRAGGLLVVGPPGSGRSSALHAFAAHLRSAGVEVLSVASPAVDLVRWQAELGGHPGAVILDDVGTLADSPVLAALPASGAGGPVVLAAGSAADVARLYQGPVAALRRNRTAVLLTPGPGDADLLGIRLPRTPVPVRPGSGWVVHGGQVQRVQVARRRIAS